MDALCIIEPEPRVVWLFCVRGGADVNVDGITGPSRDSVSPTVGYLTVDPAEAVICVTKYGACCAVAGMLNDRGGKHTAAEGLVDLNGSSSSLAINEPWG